MVEIEHAKVADAGRDVDGLKAAQVDETPKLRRTPQGSSHHPRKASVGRAGGRTHSSRPGTDV
jgi:hypothetical protein